MISAVGIKKLLYAEPSAITVDLTGILLKPIITAATEVANVHGETWQIEESEASKTAYKNQLTGKTYRESIEMGDVKMNFTIGAYDYKTKADLMGGAVIQDAAKKDVGWKRAEGKINVNKALFALTEDDIWVVFPKASITAREANTDKAIGLAVTGSQLESGITGVSSEYWINASEVK
ncbi:MAG: hypothetical protein RRY36_10110 [Bacteroidaceae bacterium]